jgi:hypothetical protein
MPLTQESAGPISRRTFYYDTELNNYLDSLVPPPMFQVFRFGTVELNLQSGLKTTWGELEVSPAARHVIIIIYIFIVNLSNPFSFLLSPISYSPSSPLLFPIPSFSASPTN